ncbi:hypothetical protein ABVK25_004082 [Lepraria finkii]|uniref:Uncharacterized protein n=1 Tax=Lepraria finkii TaxID=1340010 RepID=A0ABR4BIU4_9LECA
MVALTDLPREIREMVYEEILIYEEVNINIIDRDEAMGIIWAARDYDFRINLVSTVPTLHR